jgi:hypothetical protein
MRRTDLFEATMQGVARLNPLQRQRFFEAFLKAALRLDRLELRAWLRRRLQYPPLAAIDPGRLQNFGCRYCCSPAEGGQSAGRIVARRIGAEPTDGKTWKESKSPAENSGSQTELFPPPGEVG